MSDQNILTDNECNGTYSCDCLLCDLADSDYTPECQHDENDIHSGCVYCECTCEICANLGLEDITQSELIELELNEITEHSDFIDDTDMIQDDILPPNQQLADLTLIDETMSICSTNSSDSDNYSIESLISSDDENL